MAMTKTQEMARAVMTQQVFSEIINQPVVTVPKRIKNPKEWTVMETAGAAINGSYVRYSVGQKLDNPTEVALLRDAGIKIEATA